MKPTAVFGGLASVCIVVGLSSACGSSSSPSAEDAGTSARCDSCIQAKCSSYANTCLADPLCAVAATCVLKCYVKWKGSVSPLTCAEECDDGGTNASGLGTCVAGMCGSKSECLGE